MRVVGDQRVRIGAVDLDRLELPELPEPQALRPARPEPDRLAVLQLDQLLAAAACCFSGSNASSLKMGQFW